MKTATLGRGFTIPFGGATGLLLCTSASPCGLALSGLFIPFRDCSTRVAWTCFTTGHFCSSASGGILSQSKGPKGASFTILPDTTLRVPDAMGGTGDWLRMFTSAQLSPQYRRFQKVSGSKGYVGVRVALG